MPLCSSLFRRLAPSGHDLPVCTNLFTSRCKYTQTCPLRQSLRLLMGTLRRGCGDLSLEAPVIYSAVDTSDMHAAVLHIQRIYPEAPLFLAGFSLGAMLVTKYLADTESGALQPAGLYRGKA